MKMLLVVSAVVLLVFPPPAWGQQSYFVDENDAEQSELDYVGDTLATFYGTVADRPITIRFHDGDISSFNHADNSVHIADVPYQSIESYHRVLGHEASHLAMYRMTNGASLKNDFHFLDEGFASIMENKITNTETFHKKIAINTANYYLMRGVLGIREIQDWQRFFGGESAGYYYWYAYRVGSSFIYLILDEWGEESLRSLLLSLSQTSSLEESMQEVLGISVQNFERRWHEYVRGNASEAPLAIVSSYPKMDEQNVPVNTSEISIAFSMPMRSSLPLVTPCEQNICYTNAYWKTPNTLAIKLLQPLWPNHQYVIQLGFEEWWSQLESSDGVLLPITNWVFTTAK